MLPDFPFLKVLCKPNFASVKIVTIIYICMHVCACLHFTDKHEIMKDMKAQKKINFKHRKPYINKILFASQKCYCVWNNFLCNPGRICI